MAESRKVLVEVELPSELEVDERTLSKAIRLALRLLTDYYRVY